MDKTNIDSLSKKLEDISKKLEISNELIESGNELENLANEAKNNFKESENFEVILNLEQMISDFSYIREVLKEITDNARRVQNSITLDLINSDDEKRASLVASFAELSKAITDAQKLFVQSYKDISHTLLNLDKIKKERVQNVPNQQNTVEKSKSDNVVSTFELIKKLKNS